MQKMSTWETNEEIKFFREYLRIPSVHPDVDYGACVDFLKNQANNLGLPIKVYYPATPKHPVAVITWVGSQPELPSIILNSHMDVVPVYPDRWTYPPFAAEIDSEGRIFARGSQDMKCVGMQYLASVRFLKRSGITLKRTIHIVFVPDEEIGGKYGMEAFLKSGDFKKLNIGFALDEGIASPFDVYPVFFAERSIWRMLSAGTTMMCHPVITLNRINFLLDVNFKINGTAGHGSLLHKNTAGEKLRHILDKLMAFRENQSKRLEDDNNLTIGDVTTVNLTMINGGVQNNVVPPLVVACFDMRLAIDLDHQKFEEQLQKWCDEAGGDIEIEYEQKEPKVEPTKVDATNPFWVAFRNATEELGLKIRTQVFTGGTDSRYIREAGIPAIGFSPMNNTPVLLHDHDEFIKVETYLNGIEIYNKIIPAIANI